MPSETLSVTLLAPGCFSATELTHDAAENPGNEGTSADVNDARAVATDTQVYEQALAAALKQPIPAVGELSVARYQFPLDSDDAPPQHCVCAEFVHFQADKDNARLLPEAALSISDEESAALLGAFNSLIEPDGLHVQRSISGRCYLTGMAADALDTWPAHAVANGKIANYLPRAAEAGPWRRLITEVQMLFHAHPVNTQRVNARQLPINGMWFWGGATTAPLTPVTGIALVADDPYAMGLGAALDVDMLSAESHSWTQLSERYLDNPDIQEIVIVDLFTYEAWLSGDHSALITAKQRLHEHWITPLQQGVSDGLVSEFVLDGCEGQSIVELQATSAPAGRLVWFTKLNPQKWLSSLLLRHGDK